MKPVNVFTMLSASLLAMTAGPAAGQAQPIPNPAISLVGHEYYTVSGRNFVRYRFDVSNKADYPAELFVAAPNLPPCGLNPNSSRTWVDIYEQGGRRLYGFCALGTPEALGLLWFAIEVGAAPPSQIYMEMTDRQTNTKYRSNLMGTSPPDSLRGHWVGSIAEPRSANHPNYSLAVRLEIDRAGRPVGTVEYDAFPCAGIWSNAAVHASVWRLDETITEGRTACAPNVVVELTPRGDEVDVRLWPVGLENQPSSGTLRRRP